MLKKIRFICDGRKASLLSLKHYDEIKEAFAFSVPSARYTPQHKHWLAEKAQGIPEKERSGWNGKISLMKNGIINVGLLIGAKEELTKAGFAAEIKEWKNSPKVEEQMGFTEDNEQYQYQNDCVQAMIDSISNAGGGLVLSATGTGKTKIAAQFFSWLKCECLFVVDQLPLLYQAQKEIQEWLSSKGFDDKVGIVGNGKWQPERVTVATVQTLHAQKDTLRFKKWVKEIQVVLVDELHVQMGFRNFNVLDKIKPQAVIGLTATLQLKQKPIRMKCWSIAGPLLFEFPLEKGVEAGVLSQGVVVQVPIASNNKPRKLLTIKKKNKRTGKITKVKEPADDYMHEVVYNDNANRCLELLVEECVSQDLCVVVLVHRILHIKLLEKRLDKFGPKLFYGAIDVDTRKKQLVKFEKGKENLILANQVFTKGINVKRIDVVIDGAQKSSKDDAAQKYGRAARLHAEKAGIYYIDLFTEGKLEKAAKSRKSAFKKLKVPIKVMTRVETAFGPKGILREADKMLMSALKSNKEKFAQGKLF